MVGLKHFSQPPNFSQSPFALVSHAWVKIFWKIWVPLGFRVCIPKRPKNKIPEMEPENGPFEQICIKMQVPKMEIPCIIIHQKIQVPKMEGFWSLFFGYFGGWVFPYISRNHRCAWTYIKISKQFPKGEFIGHLGKILPFGWDIWVFPKMLVPNNHGFSY